ncbi:hypothetical protein J32TS6_35950 [Virgibacillus pantothenticus]|uniref:Uncharacterized protein n=1 Tax=Virgibacillus pantothenticus TaxID=1473 RepID=A0A0L0QRN1_VIRPA|nr:MULTISPECIES: hypothetical protein [Virgibacillus]API92200.1 hypothetical protein BKP57_10380 [Virgibacillus sp. 6R]KNE21191.1 hypothetical protein AFK71_05740 [Virgibacillus pantothenticus]MBS7427203.1 hypothetical protein [Virgibacillus sp. 19R1-5]MBU8567440.1 hypothetical protein [Virgibacillus pantothenticus]MBU8665055.1 hypothetical protein [Virgibacillus pantothenticus]
MLDKEGIFTPSSSSVIGTIVYDPDITTPFLDLVDMIEPIATGFDLMGGIIQNKKTLCYMLLNQKRNCNGDQSI